MFNVFGLLSLYTTIIHRLFEQKQCMHKGAKLDNGSYRIRYWIDMQNS